MKMKVIKKAMDIPASPESVFRVLVDPQYIPTWYAEFGEGARAETTWEEGSKVIFADDTHSGLIGTVVVNRPGEMLSVEYTGIMADGFEDYDSELAKEMKGSRETYILTEKGGVTTLSVSADMGEEYYEVMSEAWDKAMVKIRDLALSI